MCSVCLREHGTHEILAIAGRRHGAGGVVGVDTRPDDRRVADPAFALVDDAADRGVCGKVAELVTGDRTDGAVFVCVIRAAVVEHDAHGQFGIGMRKRQTVFCSLPCFINVIHVPRGPLGRSRLSASICSVKNSRRAQKTWQKPVQRGQRAIATCGDLRISLDRATVRGGATPRSISFLPTKKPDLGIASAHAVQAVGQRTYVATLPSLNGRKTTSAI